VDRENSHGEFVRHGGLVVHGGVERLKTREGATREREIPRTERAEREVPRVRIPEVREGRRRAK